MKGGKRGGGEGRGVGRQQVGKGGGIRSRGEGFVVRGMYGGGRHGVGIGREAMRDRSVGERVWGGGEKVRVRGARRWGK